ncbi:MAG: hypothetical protein IJI36_04020 [Kiritimatiellae bacterium]|nr:hypothetical protein [Kiritimatiellia bacterium]
MARYVGNRRLEADETAPWEARPEAESASASEPAVTETPASEPAAESPKPDDTSQQALTYTAFADAMNKAIEQEDIAGAAILENRMMRLNMDFESQPHEVQAKVAKAIRRLHNRLTPEERKNAIHFGERERVMDGVADDADGDGQTAEGGDEEADFSHSRANERYDVGVDDTVFDNRTETQREAAEEAASKEAAKKAKDAQILRGGAGTGGGRAGNRVLQVQSVDGDDVYVSLLDSTGRDRGLPPQKMSRAQWEMLAKAGKNLNNADPANPQEGDNIMMSRSAPELPAERAAEVAESEFSRCCARTTMLHVYISDSFASSVPLFA